MGNIIVPPSLERRLRQEHELARSLLQLEALDDQEKELIERTAWDQGIKLGMSLGVGLSFALSLKRYFPEAFFTNSTGMYVGTTLAIILPCFCLANMYTNREVIHQLGHLEELHRRVKAHQRVQNRK